MAGPGRPKKTEMENLQDQFEKYDEEIKGLTLDRMNEAPKKELEVQTKLSQKELEKSKDVYLKPKRSIASREKFNENYRDDYNREKEYVHIIAENHEVIGETITMWTKRFAGVPAEEWDIPVNKPIHVPKYVANQIANCTYHRLRMVDKPTTSDGNMTYYGSMTVDDTINRLDAHLVPTKKTFSMGKFS